MGVKVVKREGDTLKEKLYLSAIFSGMKVTFGHFSKNIRDIHAMENVCYPEQQPSDITPRYRGVHRLTKRADESIACVACFMCATACPATCINIIATQREDNIDEKMPQKFEIDLLECIFCGYCVEACPCDAIRMDSGIFSVVEKERKDFIYDKEKLLSIKGAFGSENSHAK